MPQHAVKNANPVGKITVGGGILILGTERLVHVQLDVNRHILCGFGFQIKRKLVGVKGFVFGLKEGV